MTNKSDDLPVLVIDGTDFSDFDGFAREFSRLLRSYRWRGSLDAFNDLLRGGVRNARERMGAEVAQL
jgi:RNAse (barnase) inhibitor barstar